MTLARAASIDDLRALARRRMPRFAFDFIDGGAEDEINLRKNRSAFEAIELLPRHLRDISSIETRCGIFGRDWQVPFGIAPVGFLNMAWPGADLMIARLAADTGMPHVISTASSTPLEDIAEAAKGNVWFQLYIPRDDGMLDRLLRRVEGVGCDVMMVTVDVAQPGKRDRDIRNGLQVPFRPNLRIALDLLCHPAWSLKTLADGAPRFGNFTEKEAGGDSPALAEIQERLIAPDFTWDRLKRFRDRWEGPLLLKGILHPDDAVLAVEAGCDGIVVSNHGGRQADYGPATIAMLPALVEVIGGRIPVALDSGIRRGCDIAKALALGASFVLAGRAFAYGAGAGGEAGCRRAFEILDRELRATLGQIGCPHIADLDERIINAPGS